MTQPILEGTPGELAPYLAQHPNRKFRLIELTEGADETALEQPAPLLDDKAKAAIALLDQWIAEGKAADEKTQIAADQEVEEFKRNMNPNRAKASDGVDFEDDSQVDRAVLRAAQNALREHKKHGYPIVAWQDGKVVRIAAEDIVVPDENE